MLAPPGIRPGYVITGLIEGQLPRSQSGAFLCTPWTNEPTGLTVAVGDFNRPWRQSGAFFEPRARSLRHAGALVAVDSDQCVGCWTRYDGECPMTKSTSPATALLQRLTTRN